LTGPFNNVRVGQHTTGGETMIYKREEFLEENDADRAFPVKQIEQLTSLDGSKTKFIGRVSLALQTPMGVTSLPVTFEIPSGNIAEAFAGFAERAETAIEESKKELETEIQEMRRKSQSRIITPDGMPPISGNPGGKIKLS
jgi:hypothetical protein